MFDWLSQLHSTGGLQQLIAWGGLLLLCVIVFAETGVLAGFFLPGDSLLLTAGVCSRINPLLSDPNAEPLLPGGWWLLVIALSISAILGDGVNYAFGRWASRGIWDRPDGRFFKRRYLTEARDFYARWGGIAISGGRFVPIVRTFVPFAAGMSRMPMGSFLAWNVAGGIFWVVSMTGVGYWLAGNETMVKNLHYLVLAVIAVSFVPVAIGVINRWRRGPTSAASLP